MWLSRNTQPKPPSIHPLQPPSLDCPQRREECKNKNKKHLKKEWKRNICHNKSCLLLLTHFLSLCNVTIFLSSIILYYRVRPLLSIKPNKTMRPKKEIEKENKENFWGWKRNFFLLFGKVKDDPIVIGWLGCWRRKEETIHWIIITKQELPKIL